MIDALSAIERALDADDLETAGELAASALAQGNRHALVFNLAAWRAENDGRLDEAESIMREALDRYPGDASLWLGLGVTLRTRGSLKEAVDAIEAALKLDPDYATAWLERGATFERGGAIADAILDYRQAIAIEPDNVGALAALGTALARHGELQEARIVVEKAVAIDRTNVQARTARAKIALEERRYDDAAAALKFLGQAKEGESDVLVSGYTLLGDAQEGAGRYDEAYAAYSRAQSIFRALHEKRSALRQEDPQIILDRIAVSFANADKSFWRGTRGVASPADKHIFLTGYPRSGTTLVENILATLPGAVAIEERPTLADVEHRYLTDPDGMERFARLPEIEIDRLRGLYWERAERAAGEALAERLFVDMDPFKGTRLPIIARLFPDAKVVVMRRDPRDVVWSCFHTNFVYNAGTMAFTSLERTALHYARTWEIIESALTTLPIDHFNLRYDALVREFDSTTRALCHYLDVPWDERLSQFDRTARERGVSTASVSQVRKGLYDGSGGWRRYAKHFAKVEPILAPWIASFERVG